MLFAPVAPEKFKLSMVEVTGVTRTELMGLLLLLVGMTTLAFAVGAYGDWPRIKEVARQIALQHETDKTTKGEVKRFWVYLRDDPGVRRAIVAFLFLPLLSGLAAVVLLGVTLFVRH